MGSIFLLPIFIVIGLLGGWVFYAVLKAAVRDGILEADVRRARLRTQVDQMRRSREVDAEPAAEQDGRDEQDGRS